MTEADKEEQQTPPKAAKDQFKRFAEAALKVGLLVSKRDYNRYFRGKSPPKRKDE